MSEGERTKVSEGERESAKSEIWGDLGSCVEMTHLVAEESCKGIDVEPANPLDCDDGEVGRPDELDPVEIPATWRQGMVK